jgi:hypothetical protein
MPRLSAIDAVSPAIERTKTMLFRPFKFKIWMIMGVIGWLAGEGMGGGFNFSFPMGGHGPGKSAPAPPGAPGTPGSHFPVALIVLTVAVLVVVGAAIAIAFTYLFSRFRFVLFESVLTRQIGIDPGWKKYRGQAHRFFWFWVCAGLTMMVAFALAIGVPVWIAYKRGAFDRPPALDVIFSFFALFFLVILGLVLLAFVFMSLAKDFLVPVMALDDLGTGRAWSALRQIVKAEPWSFAGYLGLKLVMTFVVSFALAIPLVIVFFVLIIGGVVVAIVGSLVIHNPGHALIVAAIVVGVVLAIALFIFLFGLMIFVSAPASVFFTSYALYFFGGRYPKLGELMWPTPIEPPYVPPPPPPPLASPAAG